MDLSASKQEKRYSPKKKTQISHHLDYPLHHMEDVLLPLFEKNYTIDSLRVTIESANHVWCAYENDKCIGCALITDVGSHHGLYMILFGVSKSAQGRGVGTRLLRNIIKWSRQNGHAFIYLHTEYDNENAVRLYEKYGFQKEFCPPDFIDELPQYGSDVLSMMLLI